MKTILNIAGLLVLSASLVCGQMAVEVRLDQESFLSAESMPVSVRVSNRSGQPLEMGGEADWLTFSIESKDGYVVEKLSDAPVLGEFTLESGKVATKRVDLSPHFAALQPGRYNIIASVRVKQWGTETASAPKAFDVVRGAKLWSQEFGVPQPAGSTNRFPEMRRYTFEQANHLRSQLRLYFRLTDAAGTRVMKVHAVGPMISFSNLDQQLDRDNNLHALWRTGRQSSTYVSFNTDGEITARRTYEIGDTSPKLARDENGKIVVNGGVRRITPDDISSETPDASAQITKP